MTFLLVKTALHNAQAFPLAAWLRCGTERANRPGGLGILIAWETLVVDGRECLWRLNKAQVLTRRFISMRDSQ